MDNKNNKNIIVNTQCPFCGTDQAIEVPEKGYTEWREGKLIQFALPTLTASQREAIMTGICDECFP